MMSINDVLDIVGLSKDQIIMISELDDTYYIRPKIEYKYDSTMWKVNKNSGEKELFDFLDYITMIPEGHQNAISDEAKELNI